MIQYTVEERYLLDLLTNPFSSLESIIEGASHTLDRQPEEIVQMLKNLNMIKEDYHYEVDERGR